MRFYQEKDKTTVQKVVEYLIILNSKFKYPS